MTTGWGIQDAAVVLVVLGAVAWLVRRALARRKKPTCGCENCPGAKQLAEKARAARALRRHSPPGS